MQTQEELYRQITAIVSRLQRSHAHVYPWMVAMYLDDYRAEQTVRRDMSRLARAGVLVRIGGSGARQGYVTPAYLMRQYRKRKQTTVADGLSAHHYRSPQTEQLTYKPPPVIASLGTAPRSPEVLG